MAAAFLTALPGYSRQLLRFLVPADCTACGAPLGSDPIPLFCLDCWKTIAPLPTPRCARCDQPFASAASTTYSHGHVCQTCRTRPPSYTRAWTLYPYLPPLQDAICLFKYRGKVALASSLAQLLIHRLPPIPSLDLIMPVPLHGQRLRTREFNQALLLADRLAGPMGTPVSHENLIRVVPSIPQTTLTRSRRMTNLRGAFALRQPNAVKGARILLIDDVFTTGTTLNECAKSLRKAGSSDVYALTLARTLDAHLRPDHALAPRPRKQTAGT